MELQFHFATKFRCSSRHKTASKGIRIHLDVLQLAYYEMLGVLSRTKGR